MEENFAALVRQLQATLGKMEVALGTISEAIVWTGEDGKVQWSNATFDHLVGQQRFDILGANLLDLLVLYQQGQPVTLDSHPLTQALREPSSQTGLYEFHRTEQRFTLEIFSTQVQFKGQEISAVLVIRDVTERQKIQQRQTIQFCVTRILAQTETLEAAIPKILQAVCEGDGWELGSLWQTDSQAESLYWQSIWHHPEATYSNTKALNREITFALGEGLPGRVWQSRQPVWIRDIALDSTFRRTAIALRDHFRTAFAFPILNQEELIGVMEFFSATVRQPDDDFLLLMLDIGSQISQFWRRKQAEAQIQQQLQELEKLNRVKDEFLSTVSHELRTPISNMRMAIELLKVAPTSDRREHYLTVLQAQCLREADLINDLLDLQRLDAMSYSPTHRAIVLEDWLPRVIEPFESRIQAHQQRLHVERPDSSFVITLDCTGLERILVELLNNACKYTPREGEIHLKVEVSVQETTEIIVVVQNQATIPAADLPHIFEKFYRIAQTDIWRQGGTGLGLTLVQKLVEQMQGEIRVESHPNQTTFTVRIPVLLGLDAVLP
jgi:PAS domain S-box-containing protein